MAFTQVSSPKKKTRPSKGRDSLGNSRGATLIAQTKGPNLFKAVTVPTDRPYTIILQAGCSEASSRCLLRQDFTIPDSLRQAAELLLLFNAL